MLGEPVTTSRRLVLAVVAVAVGGALAFALGLLSVERGNDTVYVPALVITVAAATLAALALALGKHLKLASAVALGTPLSAALLVMFVFGLFIPYAAGWGHRDLEQFGGSDWSWPRWLAVLLALAALCGSILGAVLGLGLWALRLAQRGRQHS